MTPILRGALVLALHIVPCALPAQTSAQADAPPAAPAAASSLQPGDVVRITVWRKPELSGEFTIASDGSIAHPLYRAVAVAGVPMAVAERRLLEFLATYEQNPQIVLEPLFRVTVGGEVRTPNLYSLQPQTTIAQAIALAGGPTDRGRLDRVRVLRGGRSFVADLTSPDGRWVRAPVMSGDQILVARSSNVLRDYVGPFASLTAAAAALVAIFTR